MTDDHGRMDAIRQQARELGFDTIGFTSPALPESAQAGLNDFLTSGHHGDMQWMEANAERRGDPLTLWPEARSVIVLGHNYGPEFNPLEKLALKERGAISCYALNEDYHDVIKKRLKQMARRLVERYGCDVKVFVDTAPVMEKPLAESAGLGWQGKHTCLVSREFGSWLFLGSIFTTLPLLPSPGRGEGGERNEPGGGKSSIPNQPTSPHPGPPPDRGREQIDHCGTCTRCLDICPTQAFTAARRLDARKCISYLTIEHKGQIPLEYRKAIGNRIYGCDDCLAVCPWNKFAQTAREAAYHPRATLQSPLLAELAQLDDAAFRTLFSKSPIKRIGRDRFVRNVLIAIGNSEDASLADVAAPLLHDASPLVAEMAAWALGELQTAPIY